MEITYTELSTQIKQAYCACHLKDSDAFNSNKFEKMLEVLCNEYQNKGIERNEFENLVVESIKDIKIKEG